MDDVSTDGANAAKAARWAEGCRRHKAISRLCRLRQAAAAKIRCGGRRLGAGGQPSYPLSPHRALQDIRHGRCAPAQRDGKKIKDLGIAQIIEETIHNVYLKPTRPTLTHLVDCVHARCTEEGVAPPHRRTVRARVKAIDIRVRGQRRGERDIVKATTAVPGEYAVSRPLEVVQIDHTEIDIIVVDELTRTPLPGRPWLTLAIDVFSRVVTGLHVSVSAPSRVSAGLLGTGSANPVSH